TALIAGGLLVPVIVHQIGARRLYVVQAIAFVGAFAVLGSLVQRRRAVMDAVAAAARPQPRNAEVRGRYLAAVFGVVFLSMLAYILVRNIFLDRASAQFPEPSDYAAQIGFFNACQGV